MIQRFPYLPGLLLTLALSLLSQWLGILFGFSAALTALVMGIVVGVLTAQINRGNSLLSKGFSWGEKQGLGLAIALMGFQMPWLALMTSGGKVLLLVCLGLVFTFVVTYLLSRLFKLSQSQTILMATGNGICGSAAVMATQSIIKSNRSDTAMVVTLVNLLGLLGIIITPMLVLQFFPSESFQAGQLIGNTLQSMPHVVAAGFTVGDDVAQTAVWVKMVRILMLLPVLFILAWWQRSEQLALKNESEVNSSKLPWLALIPVFIWGFLVCAFMVLWFELPKSLLEIFDQISDILMCMALVAIGAQIDWQKIRHSGGRLMLMGVLLFALQLSFSALLISHI